MKGFYLVPRTVWAQYINTFAESHYLDTDDPDMILVACRFHNEANMDHWEEHPNVETVPHPLVDAQSPIKAEYVDKLKGMGMKHGDKASDIVKRAGQIHSAFKTNRLG